MEKLLYTETEAAERLTMTPRKLADWRRAGKGPKHIKVGQEVRYTRTALDQWVDDQVQNYNNRET